MMVENIEQIYFAVIFVSLICLLYLSSQDIKSKEISRNITLSLLFALFLFHAFAFLMYNYEISYQALLGCLVLGVPFLLCVLITKEKALGLGDVYIFMIMGLMVGLQSIFFALSFMVIAALSFSLIKNKKVSLKQKIPLVPFITFGIMMAFLFNYLLL